MGGRRLQQGTGRRAAAEQSRVGCNMDCNQRWSRQQQTKVNNALGEGWERDMLTTRTEMASSHHACKTPNKAE